MKKLLTFLLLLMLMQPLAVLAQTSLPDKNITDFCTSDNGKLLRKNVVAVNRYCGSPTDCYRLSDALIEGEKAKVSLATEKDRSKKASLESAIVTFSDVVAEKNAECLAFEDLLNEQNEKQRSEVSSLLGGMGGCTDVSGADATICKRENNPFAELQDAILLGNLVTILEEPISSDNVFNRARICEVDFVRDNKGNLQQVPGASNRYAIRPTDCRSYIVERCIPTRSNLSSVVLTKNAENGYDLNVAGSDSDVLPVAVYCDKVQVIWADSGVNLLKKYVGMIYRFAVGIVGVIAVLVIMVSGIQISASNGDSAKIDEAKGRIIQSIVALAVLFLSGIILYAINPTFFTAGDPSAAPDTVLDGFPSEITNENGLGDILDKNNEELDAIEAAEEAEAERLFDDR